MSRPHVINLKRGGKLILSQLRTGEMSITVDYGKGLTGVLLEPLEGLEAAMVLTEAARRR